MKGPSVDISVVCPSFNEALIIDASVGLMLDNLRNSLDEPWELIVVDDGSTDDTLARLRSLATTRPELRVVTYAPNRGRGYAIRQGVLSARGEVVVTTEVDCSWGETIVRELVAALRAEPGIDIVVASPHLRGGGYENVPMNRVLLSKLGNRVLRAGISYGVTMYTGMTRAYRRESFRRLLPLREDEKEQHLEILNVALALGMRIVEIPAVLAWKEHRLTRDPTKKRKSSAKILKLIRTHLVFSLVAAPFRFLYPVAGLLLVAGLVLLGFATARVVLGIMPAVYLALAGLLAILIALVVFGVGLLTQQNRALMTELWRLQRDPRRED